MRLVAGTALIVDAVTTLRGGPPILAAIPPALRAVAGLLLLAGLWTPVVAVVVAVVELWKAVSSLGDPWTSIVLGTLGVARFAPAWFRPETIVSRTARRKLDASGSPRG